MLESVFLYAAVGGGVVLLWQLAMMLLGFDDTFGDGADVDIDFDSDGASDRGLWLLEMLSLRTLAAAATLFGIVGTVSMQSGQPPLVAFGLAALAGYVAMYTVYWLFKQVFKLETSGNQEIANAVGLHGEVYIPIDAAGGRAGKVHLKLQGRTVEYQAVTRSDSPLATGEKVVIVDVATADTVVVEAA